MSAFGPISSASPLTPDVEGTPRERLNLTQLGHLVIRRMIGPLAACGVCPTAILRQVTHKLLYAVVIDGIDDLPLKPPTA